MNKRSPAPEVNLPKEFHVPETDGEDPGEFDAVCTFKSKGDGKYCLVQIGDTKFDYQEPKDMEKEPDYKEMSKSMVSQMTPQEGMGNMQM